jgi:hypothetical protein
MLVIDWLRWRVTESHIRDTASEMLESSGDQAFLICHAEFWRAQREGDERRARFKKAVCAELARQIQRREVLRAMIPPPAGARRRRDPPVPRTQRISPRVAIRAGRRAICGLL